MVVAVCQPGHKWEGGSGPPGSESSPQPFTSEKPIGSSLPCQDLSCRAGGRRELVGWKVRWRRSAGPPNGVRRNSQLLCKGFFPLQRKQQKYWNFLGAPAFEAAGCTSPFLFKSWKPKALNAWLTGLLCVAVYPLLLPPQTSSCTRSLLHQLEAPAWAACVPSVSMSPERLEEVEGGESED